MRMHSEALLWFVNPVANIYTYIYISSDYGFCSRAISKHSVTGSSHRYIKPVVEWLCMVRLMCIHQVTLYCLCMHILWKLKYPSDDTALVTVKVSLCLALFCSASSQLSFRSDALFSPLVASQTFSDTNVTVLHGWPKQCYQYTENTLFFNSSARVMEPNPIAAASEILEKWQHLRGSGIVNCNHILSANNSCQSDWKCLRLWNKMVAWRAKYKLHKEMAYKLVATSLSCTKSLSNCNFVL